VDKNLELLKRINKAVKLVGKKDSIIRKLYEVPRYNDEPKLFHYSAELFDTRHFSDSKESVDRFAGGASFSQEKAIIKSLGEAFERYCLAIFKKDYFIKASAYDLGNKALNLFSFVNFSKKQLLDKNFPDIFNFNINTKFDWIKAYSIIQRKFFFIPAQLIYVPYQFCGDEEKIIRFPITTGAATGGSLKEAIYKGICEIVERDAFMITYLNKLPRERIDLSNNKEFSYILNLFKRYKLELFIFDITSDIKIPSFLAVIIDNTGKGPAVCLGLKASLNYRDGIIGAIEEAQHARPWIRDLMLSNNLKKIKGKNFNLSKLEDRALFWSHKKMIKHLNFLLENKSAKSINKIFDQSSDSDLKNFNTVLKILNNHDLEVVFTDITIPRINEIGFKVVKVIIPQLQPLYLNEQFKYLGGERLYKVPKILGYTKDETKEDDLNHIPHPFL
jgi:ribosomal protein S12 methylthiotransferase accessory factor